MLLLATTEERLARAECGSGLLAERGRKFLGRSELLSSSPMAKPQRGLPSYILFQVRDMYRYCFSLTFFSLVIVRNLTIKFVVVGRKEISSLRVFDEARWRC